MFRIDLPKFFLGTAAFFLVFLSIMSVIGKGQSAEGQDDQAKKAGFVPHKALYEIRLAETKSGSQIVNISGQMFYEWKSACDAWISDHRFRFFS